MAFIVKKTIHGREYYYLNENKRVNGKVKTKTIAYLGKNKKDAKRKSEEIIKNMKIGKENGVKITYFVHGTTMDNEKKISTGQQQGELSELGIKQSKELVKKILNKKFDAVFSSDLKRAVDSAKITFGKKHKIILDKRLRECNYGDLNGSNEEKVIYDKHINEKFSNGESLLDVEKRVSSFLNYLSKEYQGKHIAIVSHKAFQLAIEVLLNKKTWAQAIEQDWRKKGSWQPGWAYHLKETQSDKNENLEQKIPKEGDKKEKNTHFEKENGNEFTSFVQEGGFIWGPEPEIYGGLAGFYTYGPIGKLLKNKVENSVRRVFNSNGFREMEGPTVMPDIVWKASGHLNTFSDRTIKCKKCKANFRADKLIEEKFNIIADNFSDDKILNFIKEKEIKCPSCNGNFEEKIQRQSLMMKTNVAGQDASLRPETATVTYLPFLRLWNYFRKKLPFAVYQIGKAYRNEISPRQNVIRGREFTQAEAQIFLDPLKKNDWSDFDEIKNEKIPLWSSKNQKNGKEWTETKVGEAFETGLVKSKAYAWCLWLAYNQFLNFGIPKERIRLRQHHPDEKAFYADDAWDIEINLNSYGWTELCGVHDRTDYDLKQHSKESGINLEAMRENGEKFTPHILEIAFGTDRPTYALIDIFYEKKSEEEGKTIFRVPYHIAPIDVSVFPLMRKPELIKISRNVKEMLERNFVVDYDESGSIGRRYLRSASAGTPLAVTIDYETLKSEDVTIRNRDTEKQIRVKISDLKDILRKLIEKETVFENL